VDCLHANVLETGLASAAEPHVLAPSSSQTRSNTTLVHSKMAEKPEKIFLMPDKLISWSLRQCWPCTHNERLASSPKLPQTLSHSSYHDLARALMTPGLRWKDIRQPQIHSELRHRVVKVTEYRKSPCIVQAVAAQLADSSRRPRLAGDGGSRGRLMKLVHLGTLRQQ